VSRRVSRSTSSRLCLGSHRNSAVSPLMVVVTWTFLDTVGGRGEGVSGDLRRASVPACSVQARTLVLRASSLGGFQQRSLYKDAHEMHPIFGCTTHVGDWRRDVAGQFAGAGKNVLGRRLTRQPARGLFGKLGRRRDSAQPDTSFRHGLSV